MSTPKRSSILPNQVPLPDSSPVDPNTSTTPKKEPPASMSSSNTGLGISVSGTTSDPMTKSDSSRIQSTQAQGGKYMTSEGFAARGQGAADRNENAGTTGGYEGQQNQQGEQK